MYLRLLLRSLSVGSAPKCPERWFSCARGALWGPALILCYFCKFLCRGPAHWSVRPRPLPSPTLPPSSPSPLTEYRLLFLSRMGSLYWTMAFRVSILLSGIYKKSLCRFLGTPSLGKMEAAGVGREESWNRANPRPPLWERYATHGRLGVSQPVSR